MVLGRGPYILEKKYSVLLHFLVNELLRRGEGNGVVFYSVTYGGVQC